MSLTKLYLIISVILLAMVVGLDAHAFNVKTGKQETVITYSGGKVVVFQQTSTIRFYLATQYGTSQFYGPNISSGGDMSLQIVQDDDRLKKIEMRVDPVASGHGERREFYFTLEVRKDLPLLFVESGMINRGDQPAWCYYFWRFAPAFSDVYTTQIGDIRVYSKSIKVEDWFFLPHDNTAGGTGLILDGNLKNLEFTTLFPRADWRDIGWYIRRNLQPPYAQNSALIEPGTTNTINFIFFPAESAREVEDCWHQIQKGKQEE